MKIGLVDEDGWGETVIRYEWSDTGDELLVQLTESVRVYGVDKVLTERSMVPGGSDQVLDIGFSSGSWWLLRKKGDNVVYQRGLEGTDVPLKGAEAETRALSSVSPDGKTIARIESGGAVRFWSANDGDRIFGIRIEVSSDDDDLFGEASIESLSWSPNSCCLAIKSGFPAEDLTIVDVANQRILAG